MPDAGCGQDDEIRIRSVQSTMSERINIEKQPLQKEIP